jgi:hypothetical protein
LEATKKQLRKQNDDYEELNKEKSDLLEKAEVIAKNINDKDEQFRRAE